jgi:hypothetical protein
LGAADPSHPQILPIGGLVSFGGYLDFDRRVARPSRAVTLPGFKSELASGNAAGRSARTGLSFVEFLALLLVFKHGEVMWRWGL